MAVLLTLGDLYLVLDDYCLFMTLTEKDQEKWITIRRIKKFEIGADADFALPPGGIETIYVVHELVRQIASV